MNYHETLLDVQAEMCSAMGNPLRMRIVHLLRAKPLTVNETAEALGQNQTTISRNLSILRNANVLSATRNGTSITYQIANPKLMNICDLMRETLVEQMNERI